MRSISIFCVVVLAGGPFSVAQGLDETPRLVPEPTLDEGRDIDRREFLQERLPSKDVAPGRLPLSKANAAIESNPNEWKPQYRVVLKLTKSGQSTVSRESYSVPRTITAHRAVTREGRNGSITQVVAEENTVMEQMQREVVSPGTAVLVCDSISVAMNSLEDGHGEGFAFETKGPTRLMLGSYMLDCEALTFADGVLKLKSAQSAHGVFKMQASEMNFKLNIFGVDSSRFDQSVESLVPEQDSITNPPGTLYDPGDTYDGGDADWSSGERESGFDRRPADDDLEGEFSGRSGNDDAAWNRDPRRPGDARPKDFGRPLPAK